MDADRRSVIITIDGPAGTGKSTVARRLAGRLGLDFLDTGAMYRAAALIALEHAMDPADGRQLALRITESDLHFDWSSDPPDVMLGERIVSGRIRDLDVSALVSVAAAQSEVRDILVLQQRSIAARHPRLVTEGRDQGTIVFPEAPVKFYLTADVAVRAGRRVAQLVESGKLVDEDRVIRDIEQRDRLDATRSDGPLVRPDDAMDIDTGRRSADEVVDIMEHEVRRQLPDAGFTP